MLPVTHTETPEEAAQRQSNFILLRTLETKLPQSLFEQVLHTVTMQADFPKRIDWEGHQKNLSFSELKTNFSHIDSNFLTSLLRTVGGQPNLETKKNHQIDHLAPNQNLLGTISTGKTPNLMLALKSVKHGNFLTDQKQSLKKFEISRFERLKTVFGHAIVEEGCCASIYNVQFDKTGEIIISGADDGIIKIWDKDTLSLQASLHGHQDYIVDMSVSLCNKYLASASKDGVIIIWDLQKCRMIEKFNAHQGQVNNIKFFQFKLKKENQQNNRTQINETIQILLTCSDDGTIKIYDEQSYLLNVAPSKEDQAANQAKRNKKQEPAQLKKDRFVLTLTPEDFRPGSRNKKIDSVNINASGLVAAGTSNGEIFMWKIDFSQFKSKQHNKIVTWLGSFKKHSKSVHFSEFSPNGKLLFSGSVDGTAKIWNVEFEKSSKKEAGSQKSTFALTDDRLKVTFEERKSNSQCDCICWSVYGRYAITSISGRIEGDNNVELSFIKVWDSVTGYVIHDLCKGNNIQLQNFSFVLAPHPKVEEILMTGSDGGLIVLWNIKTRQMIKKFIEYGVYSIERYTLNDPFDGKFSPDGSSFIVGSMLGTISLFSVDGSKHKYEATRVEQFYTFDEEKHENNLYEQLQENPPICSFAMIPYEIQPPAPVFGRFKGNKTLLNEDYERQLVIRRELCQQEEEFINHQLQIGLEQNFFNAEGQPVQFQQENQDVLMEDVEEQEEAPLRRRGRPRIDSGDIQQNQGANQNQNGGNINRRRRNNNPDRQARGVGQQSRNRQANQRYQVVRRLDNLNPNIDPDNSFYDRESDENFEVNDDESDFEEDDGDESSGHEDQNVDDESFVVHRENYYTQQSNRRRATSQEERKRYNVTNDRTERAQRRQQRLKADDDEEELDQIKTRRSARRGVVQSSEEEDYDMSDVAIKTRNQRQKSNKRRLVKNGVNRGGLHDLPSSDDQSIKSEMLGSDEEEFLMSKTRKAALKKSEEANKASGRTRNAGKKNRVRYDKIDASSDEDFDKNKEEEKKVSTRNTRRRVIKDESEKEEEEEFEDIEMIETSDKNKKLRGDEDYDLIQPDEGSQHQILLEEGMIDQRKCSFCLRSDPVLIGPFVKRNNFEQIIDGPHYFHKDCIEVNSFSFYNKQKNKWMNIGKALEQLTGRKSQICERCETEGATIRCSNCENYYHGHLCSQIYMIFIGGRDYQCFKCRNLENYQSFQNKTGLIEKHEKEQICKSMPREHLLQLQQNPNHYIPQINDMVYYFFQGHERFIREYNCFFYCGDSPGLSFDYPWKIHPELLHPTLCKIINIDYNFPSNNALYLIKKFGKTSSDVQQVPQIIAKLELQISADSDKKFVIYTFPNDLADFLVMQRIYDISFVKFNELLNQNKIIGQIFNTRCKNFIKVKVVGLQTKESTIFPYTNWETILYQHQEAYRLRERGGRRGQRRPEDEVNEQLPEVMNFWELIIDELGQEELNNQQCAFEETESSTLQNVFIDYQERKKEQTEPFKTRVLESIAPDYKCHVTAEMFLDLILQRLAKNYYRHQEQLFLDLDRITFNALIYNGDEEPITKTARRMAEQLRMELKKHIFSSGEKKTYFQKEESKIDYSKPIGKLTAPLRQEGGPSTFDMFQKQQDESNGKSKYVEEAKQKLKKDQIPIVQKHPQNLIQIQQKRDPLINFNVQPDNEDSLMSQEIKTTPKLREDQSLSNGGNIRRSTRNNVKQINYNETSHDNQMNGTGEKLLRKREEAPQQQEQVLGKRSRNKQIRGSINQKLNDNEDEEDNFEDDEAEIIKEQTSLRNGGNVASNSRYSKRLRN